MAEAKDGKGTALPAFALDYIRSNLKDLSLPRGRIPEKLLDRNGRPEGRNYITADINGDSVPDWAGFLADRKGTLHLYAVFSSHGSYRHKLLYRDAGKDSEFIYMGVFEEPPGTVHGFPFDGIPEKDLLADLRFPGVHLMFYETSSILFYWEKEGFRELWTSD